MTTVSPDLFKPSKSGTARTSSMTSSRFRIQTTEIVENIERNVLTNLRRHSAVFVDFDGVVEAVQAVNKVVFVDLGDELTGLLLGDNGHSRSAAAENACYHG